MTESDRVPCELLAWDTDFFGFRIARVCGDLLQPEQMAQIDRWAEEHRVHCLYFLSNAGDPMTLRTAGQHGFALVDIRVTLECKFKDHSRRMCPPLPADVSIRPATSADVPGLQRIARTAHTATRFFNDPRFPRHRVEDFYSSWIALEVQGRAQTVWTAASVENRPLGYVSCHLNPASKSGEIGLVGVASEARGRGIGRNLVLAALDWFRTQQVREVTVVAQGNNQPAQRLYQRCGFLSRDLQLWYHKWYLTSD